jgi:dimethylamine/trimethylamine dehydrogenase
LGPDPIPGVDARQPQFATPEQVFAGKTLGSRVVVLDGEGYFMAVSLAEMLAERGHVVSIVSLFEKIAPYTDWTLEGPNLRRMLREKGIAELLSHWVEEVVAGPYGIAVRAFDLYRDGSRRRTDPAKGELPRRPGQAVTRLECDSLVLCTSRQSDDRIFASLSERRGDWAGLGLKSVSRAGDCLAPRYLADAVFDGHRIGREIDQEDPERPLAIIRERAIWGQPVIPKLGDRAR